MQGSKISGCVLGNNSYVGEGCILEQTLVLGNDYYTNDKTRAASLEKGESALGIGTNFVNWKLFFFLERPVSLLACGLLNVQASEQGLYCIAGANTVIKGAILDDNVSIGENVRITNEQGIIDADRTEEGFVIQDSIVTVLRNAAIAAGTVI